MNGSFPAVEHRHLHQPPQHIHITAETVNNRQGINGIDILYNAMAREALHDSSDSYPQPKCHPETRTKMLDDLFNWATQATSVRPGIYWLHGPAGAGKSAIMQTLCQRLESIDRLGGAFFFKRGHETRGNAKALFATLAYQLAHHNRDLKRFISQVMDDNSSVVARNIDVQFDRLIVKPCQLLTHSLPLVLLIDGLDECHGLKKSVDLDKEYDTPNSQVEILHLIQTAVCSHPSTFRFLVASRPEPHIAKIFKSPSFSRIFNSVNVEQSFEDVRRYFRDEFARIHREHQHTMADVAIPWPSPEILYSLVRKSSGYFIYASTVIKFVDNEFFRPTEQLATIQNLTVDSSKPFEALDKLYIQILSQVPKKFRSKLCDILHGVRCRLRLQPIRYDEFLGLKAGDTQLILHGLHSVLKIGGVYGIEAHHASFWDFLEDPQRSLIFYITPETRQNVACTVLKQLCDNRGWFNEFLRLYACTLISKSIL
ncbi:hypothetical protein DFH09DRAFT_1046758 [Mycena vulgaris]|nr:hypothetical protein DFH09DRAFT_1046758 [Mycena vulgaris]